MRSSYDTLSEILPICNKIGVTRLSDISYMDKLCIPNYSAILPGTQDTIWVYGGKGQTKSDARASALMEAIERYSSLHSSYPRCFIQGTYAELSKSYKKVLHPSEVVESVIPNFDHNTILDYLSGFDLLTNEEVLVPAEIALYKYFPEQPAISAFTHTHTNGLASGNVLEECICHALCEIIERDAVSIAELCASSISFTILENTRDLLKEAENIGDHRIRNCQEDTFVDDSSIFPDVDISEIGEDCDAIKSIVKRFDDADIPLLIKDISQKDISIPTFLASSVEWITHDYGYFATGSGSHPDARIALMRAITEVSQTRAANIQGARDDLKKIKYKENDQILERKWQFMSAQSASQKDKVVKFSEIETIRNEDILGDINLIRHGLKKAGLKRAIIVDLTNPDIAIPVVRAIVPGLETFEVTKSIMGNRAKEYFKRLYLS